MSPTEQPAGSEPTQPSTNPFLAQASKAPRTTLPWVLVGVFAIVSALLLGLFLAQSAELQRLRDESSAAKPTPQASTNTDPSTPQPVTDAATLEILKTLPRRVTNDPLALGKTDAPVVITSWTDFRCPFCSKWERETLPTLQPYIDSGSLRIEHRDLVLFDDDSKRTAIGARAAGAQGKFWEFSAAVAKAAPLSGHPAIDDAAVLEFAKQAGVPDLGKFAADVKNADFANAVAADTAHAQQIGINGTPFFVVNNTPINGAYPAKVFAQVIESYGGKK